jgi:polyhydroxyalkanoate synthesis repressor PhaR
MSQSNETETEAKGAQQPPVVVKKYANRRLYNTESSSYITLDSLADMVREGRDFVVYDAKTGDDITRSVLTQIIVEEESKGRALLPTGFLRQLIGFYGDSMQGLVPKFLENALTSFARQQEQMRRAMQQTMGNFFPFGMEDLGRQNMAMMERAMSLFSPFYREAQAPTEGSEGGQGGQEGVVPSPQIEIAALRAEIEELRAKLAATQAVQEAQAAQEPVQSSSVAAAAARVPTRRAKPEPKKE